MKRNLLCLLISVSLLMLTCGTEPPEEFYEGTPEDSTAIHNLLIENAELMVTEDMFNATYIPLTMGDVTFLGEDSFFRGDSTMVKRHVDSCATDLDEENSVLGTLDFWFAKDTTCTVYLFDSFAVHSLVHADVKYTAYYDSAFTDSASGETLGWMIGTTDIDSTPYYDQSDFTGNGRRLIFFDPEREVVAVDTPEVGDTIWGVVEPIEWHLKRISYGIYYFPEAGPDAPSLAQVLLTHQNGDVDTIIASSYDTLITDTTGQHVMNRFRSIDSLLEFNDGETLTVETTIGFGTLTADLAQFYASCGGAERVELPVPVGGTGGEGQIVVSGDGITNLYFEIVTNAYYYYEQPARDYLAQVWLVPVRIGGVQ